MFEKENDIEKNVAVEKLLSKITKHLKLLCFFVLGIVFS